MKDPSDLAAALGSLGGAVSDQVARRLSNRAAFERYWRGADRILADAFCAGVADLMGSSAGVLVLLYTYEDAGGLDDWVCRTFAPALPPTATASTPPCSAPLCCGFRAIRDQFRRAQ